MSTFYIFKDPSNTSGTVRVSASPPPAALSQKAPMTLEVPNGITLDVLLGQASEILPKLSGSAGDEAFIIFTFKPAPLPA